MSASTTRQRKTGGLSTTDSDGVDHAQAGPQGKKVKQTPVSQFTGRLVLAAIAVSAFYVWRLSLQSAEVGGWWNLMTGHKPIDQPIAEQKAQASAASAAAGGSHPTGHFGREETVESQILRLAGSLGVKPRQLTEAIAPLLTPGLVAEHAGTGHGIDSTLTEEEEAAAQAARTAEEEHAKHHGGVTGAVAGAVGGVGSLIDALAD